MSYNYVVTAQRPTGVWHSISGNFFNSKETNLLLNKLTRLELYTIKNDMVETVQEFNLNARIIALKAFRKPNLDKDYICVVTNKYQILVFEFIKHEKVELKTLGYGEIAERGEGNSDSGVLLDIDSKSRVAVIRIYDSCFHVVNLDFKDEELAFYDLPVEDTVIVNFCFLDPIHEVKPKLPMLSVISKERKRTNLKTYEITDDRSLRETSFKQDSIETSSHILIPVSEPVGGVIIIGNQNIAYFKGPNDSCVIAPASMEQYPIACYCQILPTKFLLGDISGNLYFLSLDKESANFNLKFIELGTTVIPTSLAYLDNNYVFVGSKFGDSQLVRLTPDRQSDSTFIQILDSFISLAPVSDMVIVDLEKQGQNQIVACCGAHKDGSLRVIRNGIGINEHGSIDLEGAVEIFSISVKNSFHDYVILCLPTETKMLKFVGEDIEQMDVPFIGDKNDTIFCGNVSTETIVHVSGNTIQMLSNNNFEPITQHRTDSLILHFVINQRQIVFSTETKLFYAEIEPETNSVIIKSEVPVESQISAIDITPLRSDEPSKFCALTYWQLSTVQILSLPSLEVIFKDKLEHNNLPRSVLISSLDENFYVFVGMGDGQLIHYNIDPDTGILQSQKKILIGCKAVTLKHFYSNSTKNIFACTDRPTVIYSRNNKLVFSTVNLKQVFSMSNLNTVSFPNSIILACEHQVIIGQIDQIQKLHILKVDLGEHPRRIAYQDSTHTFGLATSRSERKCMDGSFQPLNPNCISAIAQSTLAASAITSSTVPLPSREQNRTERDVHHFLLLNPSTFEVLHSHKFAPDECIISVNSCRLGDDPNEYFFVGTAFVNATPEVCHGRIIVFSYADNRLQKVAEKEVRGTPFIIREFNSKLLVAVNAHLNIFEWNSSNNELQDLCSISYSLNTLQVKTKGDFIICTDLVRSIKLFNFMPMSSNLVEVGRHEEIAHPVQTEFIDDDNYIMTDVFMNLCSLRKEMYDEISGKSWIVPFGCFHVGLMINTFCKGSLVSNQPCEILDNLRQKPILFATMEGSLGMICQMNRGSFDFLNALQENIIKHEQFLGNLSLKQFREFHSLVRTEEMQYFIDGDLIEMFLDFSPEKMQLCIEGLKFADGTPASIDEVTKIVEELSRIH